MRLKQPVHRRLLREGRRSPRAAAHRVPGIHDTRCGLRSSSAATWPAISSARRASVARFATTTPMEILFPSRAATAFSIAEVPVLWFNSLGVREGLRRARLAPDALGTSPAVALAPPVTPRGTRDLRLPARRLAARPDAASTANLVRVPRLRSRGAARLSSIGYFQETSRAPRVLLQAIVGHQVLSRRSVAWHRRPRRSPYPRCRVAVKGEACAELVRRSSARSSTPGVAQAASERPADAVGDRLHLGRSHAARRDGRRPDPDAAARPSAGAVSNGIVFLLTVMLSAVERLLGVASR